MKTSRRNFLKGLAAAPIVAAELAATNPFADAGNGTEAMRKAKELTRKQHEDTSTPIPNFEVRGTSAHWIAYASALPWHAQPLDATEYHTPRDPSITI